MRSRWRLYLGGLACLVLSGTVCYIESLSQEQDFSQPILNPDRNDSRDNTVSHRRATDGRFSLDLISEDYQLNQRYQSMMGPRSNQPGIRLIPELADDETVWLTGIKTQVVTDDDSLMPVSNEFFCHSNLTLSPKSSSPESHNAQLGGSHADWRFFTLVPGRMEIQLPEGFGLPVKNSTPLDHFSMVLNQNPTVAPPRVRLKTTLQGIYGQQAAGCKPLFRRALYVYQQHIRKSLPEQNLLAQHNLLPQLHPHAGELCAEVCTTNQLAQSESYFVSTIGHPGETCCVQNASEGGVLTQFGYNNTVHWMVPPGRHLYRSEVTEQLELNGVTTAHYVTGHLHPYAVSLKLIDLQTSQVVFEITSQDFSDRWGVARISEILSRKGVPIDPSHRYELVSEYNNTTAEPIDAMAILFLYLLDPMDGDIPAQLRQQSGERGTLFDR
jgi:hypothetical protein